MSQTSKAFLAPNPHCKAIHSVFQYSEVTANRCRFLSNSCDLIVECVSYICEQQFGNLRLATLLANLLNEQIHRSPSKGMSLTVIHDPDYVHVAMSTLATITLMSLAVCFFLFYIGFSHRCFAIREETTRGKTFQFSIREFLWLIVLVALMSQPL